MATRSFICRLQRDGSVNGIYCHHDGYPEGVGMTLKEHYTDSSKVDALLALGDISILGPVLGEKQNFDQPKEGWTLAYHRDRGEPLDPNMTYGSVNDMVHSVGSEINAEYAYVYDNDGWQVYEV